jgi:FkbM family methyltransferase
MRISYAQRLEDYYLDRVFAGVESGTYVDVGGGHPVADNVSFHFYLKGWRGLVAEPQADLAQLYGHVRPRDIVVDHLIGRESGEIAFHAVDRLHGFSTTREEHARGAEAFGAGYRTETRKVRPLRDLLAEHGLSEVDFLKVDVEGAEADVLAGVDWKNARPKVLCIEAVLPGSMADASGEWEPMLLRQGYRFAFFDELNRYYVANEHADLAPRFPEKVADWGVVTHFYEFGKAHRAEKHPDGALAERLIRGFLASLPERGEAEVRALLKRSAKVGAAEDDAALRALIYGAADYPGPNPSPALPAGALLDDRARAALARIAAEFDGGMISDD